MSDERDDIVDRALAALLATSGLERPPPAVVDAVRGRLETLDAARLPAASPTWSRRERIVWLQSVACLLFIVAGSWVVAFSPQLLSRHAGTHVAPDGTVWRLFSDGRIEVTAREPS